MQSVSLCWNSGPHTTGTYSSFKLSVNFYSDNVFSSGRSGGAHEPIYLMSGIPYIQMSHSSPERRFQATANSYRDTLDNFNTRVDPNLEKTSDILKVILSTIRILAENAIADYDVVHQVSTDFKINSSRRPRPQQRNFPTL